MVKTTRKLHKQIGLVAGLFLFVLSFTGFFLDHDDFDFLWNIKIQSSFLPAGVVKKINRSYEAYKINPKNRSHIIIGSRSGIYTSLDSGKTFLHTLNAQVFSIEPARHNFMENFDTLFVATSNGVYKSSNKGKNWKLLSLKNNLVNAISVWNNFIYAVVNKKEIYKINIHTQKFEKLNWEKITYKELPKKITLSRFVRDLHYGRGLFDGILSLYINDFASLVMIFLIVSGISFYFIFKKLKLKKKINKKYLKFFIKQHSSILILITFIPISILLITGVILDHAKFFNPYLKNIKANIKYLPPVYSHLKSDIWGIDFDGQYFRIGNRLGVFKSKSLTNWKLDSEGFAYRIKRSDKNLLISGMGSPNRILLSDKWKVLKNTPHMPKDFFILNKKIYSASFRANNNLPLPRLNKIPLALLFLALHDGKFFSPNWVYVNDFIVLLTIVLFITGFIRWKQSRRHKLLKYLKQKIIKFNK